MLMFSMTPGVKWGGLGQGNMLEMSHNHPKEAPRIQSQPHAALSQQKYTHLRQAERGSKPYYTSVVWWFGVILMGVGEMGNFAAYGFSPATLIAPLGCVSVIGRCDLSKPPHTHTCYPCLVGDVKAALGLSPIKTGPQRWNFRIFKAMKSW